jgi:hypothetical protein
MQEVKHDIVFLTLHFDSTSLVALRGKFTAAFECQSTIDVINDSRLAVTAITLTTARGCQLKQYVFRTPTSDWPSYGSHRVAYTTWPRFGAQLVSMLPVDQTVVLRNTQTHWMYWEQGSLLLQLKFQALFSRLPPHTRPGQWRVFQWPKLVCALLTPPNGARWTPPLGSSSSSSSSTNDATDLVLAMLPTAKSVSGRSNSALPITGPTMVGSVGPVGPTERLVESKLKSGSTHVVDKEPDVCTLHHPLAEPSGTKVHRYSGVASRFSHLRRCDFLACVGGEPTQNRDSDSGSVAVGESQLRRRSENRAGRNRCPTPKLTSQSVPLRYRHIKNLFLDHGRSSESKVAQSGSCSTRCDPLSRDVSTTQRKFSWSTYVLVAFLTPKPDHPEHALCRYKQGSRQRSLESALRARLLVILLCAWRAARASNRATTLELAMEYIGSRFQYPGILSLHAYQGEEEVVRMLGEIEGFHTLAEQTSVLTSATYHLGQLQDVHRLAAACLTQGCTRKLHSNPLCPSLTRPHRKVLGSCFLTSGPWVSCRNCLCFTLATDTHVARYSSRWLVDPNLKLYLTVTNGRLATTLEPNQTVPSTVLKKHTPHGCCTVQ